MSEAEYLSADGCAELLDLRTRDGKVSRRAFLERVACKPGFPAPIVLPDVGKRWKREEVAFWVEQCARVSRAA